MARKPPLRGILSCVLLPLASAAITPYRLTSELSCLIPRCAQDCFRSFLAVNYGITSQKQLPSLQDLCSTLGESGFTVGEGAVQCIAAEKVVGACSETDADSSVIYNAHRMCDDEPGEITPTHGVIIATLIRPSGSGPIAFPTPKIKISSSATSSKKPVATESRQLPTTLVVDTSSLSFKTPSPSTTFDTSVSGPATGIRATSSTSPTSTPDAASGGGDDKKDSGGSLSTTQKAGISAGAIGLAVVAAAIFFLFRYYRRKKRAGHSPLSSTTSRRDSWGYGFDKGNGGRGGALGGGAGNVNGNGGGGGSNNNNNNNIEPSWMSNPIHAPMGSNGRPPPAAAAAAAAGSSDTAAGAVAGAAPKPSPYSRRSWRPSAIGLAISPSHSKTTPATPIRPISKLLPAKPIFAVLDASKKPNRSNDAETQRSRYGTPPPPLQQQANSSRIASQPPVLPKLQIPQRDDLLVISRTRPPLLERESTTTEFEEDGRDSSVSPEGQIWRPPSAAPQSAATYVADKHGNWVLSRSVNNSDNNVNNNGNSNCWTAAHAAEVDAETPLSAYPKTATSITIMPIAANQRRTGVTNVTMSSVSPPSPPSPPQPTQPTTISGPTPAISTSTSTTATAIALPRETIRLVEAAPNSSHNPQHLVPPALFATTGGNPRTSRNSSARTISGNNRPRAASADSAATTITTSSEDSTADLAPPANVPQVNLSPVVESPRSGSGRSPVSYPKIPGRDTTPTGTRANRAPVPPPRTPILYKLGQRGAAASTTSTIVGGTGVAGRLAASTTNFTSNEPRVMPSVPIIRTENEASSNAIGNSGEPPFQEDIKTPLTAIKVDPRSEIRGNATPKPRQDPAFLRTGSPTMRIVEPSPEPEDDRSKLPSARRISHSRTPSQQQQQSAMQPQQIQQPQQAGQETQKQKEQQQQPHESAYKLQATLFPPYQPQLRQQEHQHPQQQRQQQDPSTQASFLQPPRQTRPSQPPYQTPPLQTQPRMESQTQAQSQSNLQLHHQHPADPSSNWIPGLPAHPHPQRRPQQSNAMWLPPQANRPPQTYHSPDRQPKPQPQSQPPSQLRPQPRPQPRPIQQQQQPQQQQPPMPLVRRPQPQAFPYPNPRPMFPHSQSQHRPPMPTQIPPNLQPQRQQGQQGPYPQHNPQLSQSASSLIAKRLGSDRAAHMAISTNHSSSSSSGQSNPWQRGSSNNSNSNGGSGSGSTPLYLSPEVITPRQYSQPGDLPSTPTWLPRLTPTRRGTDLYLDVR